MTNTDTKPSLLDALIGDSGGLLTAGTTQTTSISFTVKKFVFALLLEKAALVVPAGDPMPVLRNFQIEARPDRLRVVASDLELSVIATTELVEVEDPGTAVFPAKKMLDILQAADANGDQVRVRVNNGSASVTIGRTTWNLKLQSGSDYPAMPEIGDITLTAVNRLAFCAALEAVRYAACKDAERASLMMIDIRNGRMTACDGARFQQATVTDDLPFAFQIPIGAVNDLVKLLKTSELEDIHIGESAHHLVFSFGADIFVVNKLVATFPDLEAVLLRPALENKHPLVVERTDLLGAIRRVRITADPETSAIGLLLADNTLTVSARDKFGNFANEVIACGWNAGERTLVVNHGFLFEMIKSHDGATLHFTLGDDTKTRKAPIALKNPDAGTIGVVQQMHGEWVGA